MGTVLFSLEAQKLFRRSQVTACASVFNAARCATRAIVIEVVAIGVKRWISQIEQGTHGIRNGPR